MNQIKVGVLPWIQYTDWPSLRDAGRRADELGYDSLWTWDHLYPIQGDWRGPILEGYMTLAGWAGVTSHVTLGLMVGANPFRNPALVAKMVTTLDHMSNGRAVLGIGGAWFEREHEAYGFDFGRSAGERLDWLDEAVELMRHMLHGEPATARGPHYRSKAVLNLPPPIQAHLPILVGGSGERKTLRTVAKYADAWNTGGTVERARHKESVLRRWCDEVGRDHTEIERTFGLGLVVIRDTHAEAERVADEIRAHHPGYGVEGYRGTATEIAEILAPLVELGFRHVFFDSPAPFDQETMERFVGEVKPMLEASAPTPAPADVPVT